MKKIGFIFALIGLIGIMQACSNSNETEEAEYVPQFLDVQISVNPNTGQVNEPVMMEAIVMYGDKAVTDPSDIEFEVWRSHGEHETIEPTNVGEGVYQLEKTFTEEGTYYVIAHVQAENMHNMPKVEFVIGQPSEPEEDSKSSTMEMDGEENESPEDEHAHE